MLPAVKLLLLHILAATFPTSNALHLGPARAAAGARCIPHEREALLAFKHGIGSDPMNVLASWQKDGDCCQWRGVRCSNRTSHVLKLHLRNVHVSASSGYYFEDDQFSNTALVGQISNSLISLDNLVHLDLSMNNLTGPSRHIPDFLSSLVNLRYLNLSGIPFSGRVPSSLGNLSELQYLHLSGFQDELTYSTSMYSTDISWIAGLPMLEYLSLSMVNLSTIVDWPYVVNMIPSLKVLSLISCSLLSANQSLPRMNLTNLQRLDLSDNNFDHTMASSWVWNLTGLQYLNLEGNYLYGQVPEALGAMTSLQVLNLSFCQGMMITPSFRKLCNLTVLDLSWYYRNGNMKEMIEQLPRCPSNKLQELHLSDNNITGTIMLSHLTSLVVLDMSGNYLTGAIPPGVGQLASLSTLRLSDNNLSGHVPTEIGMLANLTGLDLSFNWLNGDITEKHFARLAKLKWLDLSGNSLKIRVSSERLTPFSLESANLEYCQIGPLFPAWLQSQVNISWLDISHTGLIDKLPNWFSTTFSKATYLDISENQINGRLPKNMEFMSLEHFYISSNKLTGQIQSLPRNLTTLDLSLNSLSTNLPSKFGTPQLRYLNLFSNNMTGGLYGSICELQNLIELDLGNNLLEGELPQCFSYTTLLFLLLNNNCFSGDFPMVLRNNKQLEFLDLSRNKFFGKLPHWIGGMVGLQFLHLSQNMFYGVIPTSITNLTRLYHLNLASNWLSGVIPGGLSSLTAMAGKYAEDHYFEAQQYGGYDEMSREIGDYFSVVTKGRELYYDVRIFEMVSIDLSCNHISGGIPDEIASLNALMNLNLSSNHLSGEVPDKIGAITSLESLDLSNNVLSGEIPASLSSLSYLSYLNLSNNNLTGTIPSGQQLDTLYAEYPSIYSGNSGLCGHPLQKMCSGNNASRQDVQNRTGHDFESMSFYFGLGFGFTVGLCVVFCVLLFKRAWRVAYFHLVDRI